MRAVTTAALVLAAVAAGADWAAVARGDRRLEYLAKPLTMLALVGVALTLVPIDEGRRLWFVAAGLLCLAGDVFLMLPRDRFVPGLVSFLLAHLCYIAGLVQLPLRGAGAAAGAVIVVAVVATVGLRVLRAVQRGAQSSLLVPVTIYLVVISTMVVAAWATGPALAAAGALVFYASDAILAWRRFVRPLPWAPVAIMVTYHLGQAMLMVSLLRP